MFLITGTVVKGLKIGEKIGFPTINLKIENNIEINPPFGVYICNVEIKRNVYKGVVHYGPKSIGTNDKKKIFCEAHLINFNSEVFNESVKIKLLKKIRDVRKFKSEDDLKKQIAKDILITNNYFNAEQT